jgi:hypothetical protein
MMQVLGPELELELELELGLGLGLELELELVRKLEFLCPLHHRPPARIHPERSLQAVLQQVASSDPKNGLRLTSLAAAWRHPL